MLKTLFNNPVSRTFIALVLSVAAVLGAFLIYVTAPENFGETDIRFDFDTVYFFADDWSLAYDYLEFEFAPGTLVVPGYHHGRVNSVLLIPPEEYPGSITLHLPEEHRGELPTLVQDNLDQALIMLDYNDYKNIIRDTGDTILLRAEEVELPDNYLRRQLDHGRGLLSSYSLFGFDNWLMPTPQTVLVQFWGQKLGSFTYYEDTEVRIKGMDFDVTFAHPHLESQFYPPINYETRALLYMVFLAIAGFGIISFVSGGLENKQAEVRGEYQPLWTAAALTGGMIYAWLLTAFQIHFDPSMLGLALLWGLPLPLIGTWAWHSRLEPQFFGISLRGLLVGVIAALAVGIFITLGSTFTLPRSLAWSTTLVPLFGAIVFREALLRGFCQRILSHWLHPLAGVIIISALWALILMGSGLVSGLGMLPFVSALGRSLLIGYIYYRTNNIFAPGLLAGILGIAPLVLGF